MARFMFRVVRRTAHVLSRPFRMMGADPEVAGPGWFESSRELGEGLRVQEDFGGDAAVARWHEAECEWQRFVQAEAQRRARTAAPSSMTASA